MYRLARWMYELGYRHAFDKIKADMLNYLSTEPKRYEDIDRGIREDDEHFKKRLDGWFAAREYIDEYFYNQEQGQAPEREL